MKKLQISLLSVFLVCLFTACQEDKVGFYEGASCYYYDSKQW